MLLVFLSISASAQKNITVSGYLTDENSSETLIGATIYDTDTRQGTTTNVFGFYSFTLPEGSHSLRFSYVGTPYRPGCKTSAATPRSTSPSAK